MNNIIDLLRECWIEAQYNYSEGIEVGFNIQYVVCTNNKSSSYF